MRTNTAAMPSQEDDEFEFWRMATVVQKTGLSKSEIYRRVAAGTFPRQRSYRGDGASKFFVSTEVREWMRSQLDEFDGLLG